MSGPVPNWLLLISGAAVCLMIIGGIVLTLPLNRKHERGWALIGAGYAVLSPCLVIFSGLGPWGDFNDASRKLEALLPEIAQLGAANPELAAKQVLHAQGALAELRESLFWTAASSVAVAISVLALIPAAFRTVRQGIRPVGVPNGDIVETAR